MQFIFEQIRTGGDRNFGYLIGDRKNQVATLVDPSYQPELLIQRAKDQSLQVTHVINTHGHGDHTNGNNRVKELTGAQIATYRDSSVQHDIDLVDSQEMTVGKFQLKILYVPGHADDHILIYIPEFQIAITGDHLFVGKIGGTMGEADARQQFESLMRLQVELPDDTTVWPGHDVGCRPSSTMALEWSTNPFLIDRNIDRFLEMKQKWGSFKAENGLM